MVSFCVTDYLVVWSLWKELVRPGPACRKRGRYVKSDGEGFTAVCLCSAAAAWDVKRCLCVPVYFELRDLTLVL